MNNQRVLLGIACFFTWHLAVAVPEISSVSELENLLKDNNVVIDYYGPWCGPCKAMLPVLETVAQEVGDLVKIVKVNIDNFAQLRTPETFKNIKFPIMSAPSFVFLKNGVEVDRYTGKLSKDDFIKRIKTVFEAKLEPRAESKATVPDSVSVPAPVPMSAEAAKQPITLPWWTWVVMGLVGILIFYVVSKRLAGK